ncbi:MAG: hypothetical protein FWG73_03730 [Planctomycetaceae bacterium]|nr:hypothetical protein [Planctomycetaceae bacterium]
MEILLIVFGLVGLSLIIVRGTIFHNFREWLLETRPNDIGYLFTCTQCMGFWVGLFGGSVYSDIITAILYAGMVSLFATIIDHWILVRAANE